MAQINTHISFKFIGDQIQAFEETSSRTYLFGFETCGYLGATFVCDKAAVMAAAMLADAVAYHKAHPSGRVSTSPLGCAGAAGGKVETG